MTAHPLPANRSTQFPVVSGLGEISTKSVQ